MMHEFSCSLPPTTIFSWGAGASTFCVVNAIAVFFRLSNVVWSWSVFFDAICPLNDCLLESNSCTNDVRIEVTILSLYWSFAAAMFSHIERMKPGAFAQNRNWFYQLNWLARRGHHNRVWIISDNIRTYLNQIRVSDPAISMTTIMLAILMICEIGDKWHEPTIRCNYQSWQPTVLDLSCPVSPYEQLDEHLAAELHNVKEMLRFRVRQLSQARRHQHWVQGHGVHLSHAPENITFATKQPKRGHTYCRIISFAANIVATAGLWILGSCDGGFDE